ncbi:hypothetical protein Tco_0019959 [Tanacetum coccineum]
MFTRHEGQGKPFRERFNQSRGREQDKNNYQPKREERASFEEDTKDKSQVAVIDVTNLGHYAYECPKTNAAIKRCKTAGSAEIARVQKSESTGKRQGCRLKVQKSIRLGTNILEQAKSTHPQYGQSATQRPFSKILCNLYPGLQYFSVNEFGVAEKPPLHSYLQLLLQLSTNSSPSQASKTVFQNWSDGLDSGVLSSDEKRMGVLASVL